MVSREGDLERKQHMVDFEGMLISDNMKPDIMVPGDGDSSPHIHTHQPCAGSGLRWEKLTVKSSDLFSRRNSICHVLTHDMKAICKAPKVGNFLEDIPRNYLRKLALALMRTYQHKIA